jgi:PEP-CTERM motif-containing protein
MNKFSPSGSTILYNMWNGPGQGGTNPLSAITLNGTGGISGQNGVNYTVTCAAGQTCQNTNDIRGLVWDPHNHSYYYASAPDQSTGDFGTAVIDDAAHTVVLTPLARNTAAHDVTFGPFTNTLIAGSGAVVDQFSEAGALLSTHTFAGVSNIDAVGTDGAGHLFGADNGGDLVFIDYDASGLIGAAGNFFANPFLNNTLDDIAQFVVPPTVPEPASLAVLGSALAGFGLLRRRRNRA